MTEFVIVNESNFSENFLFLFVITDFTLSFSLRILYVIATEKRLMEGLVIQHVPVFQKWKTIFDIFKEIFAFCEAVNSKQNSCDKTQNKSINGAEKSLIENLFFIDQKSRKTDHRQSH